MIRIDEIYYNVFAKGLQHHSDIALHWFDPFGSIDIKDLCNFPPLTAPRLRLIFWDQEPVYRDTSKRFLDQFNTIYHPDYGKKILVTSEKNSDDLEWACDTYDMEHAYYFFHGWAALDWYRGYDHCFLSTPYTERKIRYPLFIPNNIIGGRRRHRVEFLAALAKRNCVQTNRISFPEVCPYENVTAQKLAQDLGLDIAGINLPLIIDSDRNHAGNSHKIDFWDQAQECFCQVVTETAWTGRLHITEKTFKPIVMQQPFILVGSRGGLAYLREYGFKTFDSIWDESYDDLPDYERMAAIADLCADITGWNQTQLLDAHHKAQSIVEHNFRWFYDGFQDRLWDELNTMIRPWL